MAKLDEQLAALATMSPAQLRTEWQRVGKESAPMLPPDLLRMGLAYKLQEKKHGGLPSVVSRELSRLAGGAQNSGKVRPAAAVIRPGMRLVRSWQGRTISVLATDDGFLFEDRVYSSLTSIACAVTNSNRSGPRFFGLVGHA